MTTTTTGIQPDMVVNTEAVEMTVIEVGEDDIMIRTEDTMVVGEAVGEVIVEAGGAVITVAAGEAVIVDMQSIRFKKVTRASGELSSGRLGR